MPFITAENAKELAKLSRAARLRSKETNALQLPDIADPSQKAYIHRQIGRVRKQIDSLFSMLHAETDPNAIDRLAAALAKLCEIERQLAGRPLPGSLRPVRETKAARATITLTPEPQAAVVQPKPVQGPDVKP